MFGPTRFSHASSSRDATPPSFASTWHASETMASRRSELARCRLARVQDQRFGAGWLTDNQRPEGSVIPRANIRSLHAAPAEPGRTLTSAVSGAWRHLKTELGQRCAGAERWRLARCPWRRRWAKTATSNTPLSLMPCMPSCRPQRFHNAAEPGLGWGALIGVRKTRVRCPALGSCSGVEGQAQDLLPRS